MEEADQRKLQRFVTTLYSTLRAGPYNDAAANLLLNLYPSILQFWNRQFARYAEVLRVMQNRRTAARHGNEAYHEMIQDEIGHIAIIDTECEGAERMARIISTFFGKRQQLVARRGFNLALRAGRCGDDAEPDTRLLRKGIEAHLRHWEPWWTAWEDFLRFFHRDLASEMNFFHSVLNPSCVKSKRPGIKGEFTVLPIL
ncbi:hypothetical protein N7476_005092 [Penicillium atrosanguineum]|uniref:Uncharacterized protein n=1 Tax=Penicillium atrosanguineum TaxID=1132637 RepID=A0A9W9PY64_9EURO|nr:hypothetical protein N7526_011529 [Penicillium atrosanguineum]KAJ5318383.1 hypothetical protein N7476_004803 [Penicillium atrosanguineum]KAJ5318672.1 hypothetical protein N7476_005092 [Penicillium atrosanguineum]